MTDSFNQRTNLYVLAVFRGNPFRKVKKAYNNCKVFTEWLLKFMVTVS